MLLENISLLHSLNIYSIIIRILLALVLGGILGLEREQKQRPAGFRTYVVVCLGATLACITNIYMCEQLNSTDPARIPAQVISGIGFLGAGTILVTRSNHIKGLTTAAVLWCTATIGIAIGTGFYSGAILCTAVIFFSLRILSFVDTHFNKINKYLSLYSEYDSPEFIRSLIQYCRKNNFELRDLDIYSSGKNETIYATFTVKIADPSLKQVVFEDIRCFPHTVLLEEMTY